MTWDIFCKVIDNYGDIGVTWRLARQLTAEHGIATRLWVDDLAAFRHIRPEVDPGAVAQRLAGVEIRRWSDPLPAIPPGEVVIEALACDLPDDFVRRMAAMSSPPLWLNLEYLSAEDWVAGVHGLPSPHPRLPLSKYFFMPGYTERTGGLTREAWLSGARDAFQADTPAQRAFWTALTGHDSTSGCDTVRVSLFCYDNAALPGLLDAWAQGGQAVEVLAPEGKALPRIAAWFGEDAPLVAGARLTRGALTLRVTPMLDQDRYDRLLWTCDVNFVRGEDSFLRAQFAARPLVWQAYRQDEEAHFVKLEAFLKLYGMAADDAALGVNAGFWRAWNREADVGALWPAFLAARRELAAHARRWDAYLATQADLATNLLNFYHKRLK